VGGLRFVLPETPEHPGNLHVIIESFRQSRNEVFVEVKGVFSREVLSGEDTEKLRENMQTVRSFVSDAIHPYLNQFDQPQENTLP
jgi:hypothetical protein